MPSSKCFVTAGKRSLIARFAFGPVKDVIKVGGVYYKQTPNMPCNSTNIK